MADEAVPHSDPPHGEEVQFLRRTFLSTLGVSAAVFASACSRSPVGHILPFNDKPEEMTPGVPLHYASLCGGCSARCGALVKTRDGRPIKLEGNDRHPITRGGLCAVGQASVLSLYDATRARGPRIDGRDAAWADVDKAVKKGLGDGSPRGVYVVTGPDVGPTEEAAIAQLIKAYPHTKRVIHDTGSARAIAEAHLATHGVRAIPRYLLSAADVVVSIEADFLGTWLSPVAMTRAWAERRAVKTGDKASPSILTHYQVEPRLSLTGSNADHRTAARPSDTVPILAALARALAPEGLPAEIAKIRAPELAKDKVARLIDALRAAKGKALVLCGNPDVGAQALVNVVNQGIGAYGATIDLAGGVALPESLSFDELLDSLAKKEVGAVIFRGVNPAYDHPRGGELKGLLPSAALTLAISERPDETASLARVLAAAHDPFESWGDALSSGETLSLQQPTVRPLFDTRAPIASWLAFAGEPADEEACLRARWEKEVFPRAKDPPNSVVAFWEKSLDDGFTTLAADTAQPVFNPDGAAGALRGHPALGGAREGIEIALHEKVALRDGRLAHNAWLQEMPDPISKVTWTNYAVVSAELAKELGAAEGDLLSVAAQGKTLTLPVLVEPGVHPRVIAIAVGYGREAAGQAGTGRGQNAFVWGRRALEKDAVTASRVEGHKDLAKSQTEPSQHGREIARETTFAAYLANPSAGNEAPSHGKRHLTMWPEHGYPGPKWHMSIDLSACTGCSACVVACQAENNIPSVGEIEVLRRREMHWIRIDRYMEGEGDDLRVTHQPMMCQHCDNAPCETVCPVLATVHSSDGLNQQVYNRCVGTRYCANNCPPKVRRFNWFDYPHEDPLERMVLNPDVVVRSRGVMEKCSFCVQRLSEAKARAKAEGRPLRDGDARTACEQSCPAQAISFGDSHDPSSRVARLAEDERRYRILEELQIEPAVSYLVKVRAGGTEGHHG